MEEADTVTRGRHSEPETQAPHHPDPVTQAPHDPHHEVTRPRHDHTDAPTVPPHPVDPVTQHPDTPAPHHPDTPAPHPHTDAPVTQAPHPITEAPHPVTTAPQPHPDDSSLTVHEGGKDYVVTCKQEGPMTHPGNVHKYLVCEYLADHKHWHVFVMPCSIGTRWHDSIKNCIQDN